MNLHSTFIKNKSKRHLIVLISVFLFITSNYAQNVAIQSSRLVGDRIVEFIPAGFDQNKTPSLILKEEPTTIGNVPVSWSLIPKFTLVNNKAKASLELTGDISLYGGGEVTGPLLRNGQYIKLWNTDTGAYGVDGGKRLYQAHPWVMGVRRDGTAFGIIFDTSWKSELYTNSDKIIFNTEGALFRTYIIDRESPQAVLHGLSELTGTIQMPPRWTLGYHQCRFSYSPDSRVREIADTFREKNIPCDVIWMDIDYMDGYRVFTFHPKNFPDPRALNDDLHKKGFKAVYMIDPGVKFDPNTGYSIYDSGTANDVWIKKPDGTDFYGRVWPGACTFPDFTMPHVRKWWAGLYKDFLAMGIDGVWNDMNEPAVSQVYTTGREPEGVELQGDEKGTMPYNTPHRGGGNLPVGSHLLYHNAYGRLMVEASLDGIMTANPDKRPFLLTRANLLGGHRYAATWTGDNWASTDQMKLSVPMSITLGLSGQPFNGPDIGGFLNNTDGDLWANWIGFGAFMPFVRGHAVAGSNDKEPWAFGEAIEKTSRMALERRYRLLPYIYTIFYNSHKTGIPVMNPVFFANPQDLRLRSEEQVFLLGEDILVIPAFAENPALPFGIWEDLSLVLGDKADKYQAKLKVRGGSIVPVGRIVQNTNENSFDPLTLIVCLDENGKAEGKLYMDIGDGWAFQCGDYGLLTFKAERNGNNVEIKLVEKEGKRNVAKEIKNMTAEILMNGKVYKGTGSLNKGVKVVVK
ncbi:MAG: alpha-glucosidase [Bacteroidales bacterium 36-12]|nr:MAG: alpha-glucosidase [Bacteroidales bacterium 36-12]